MERDAHAALAARRSTLDAPNGFTLTEALISVGLAAVMLSVFTTVFSATMLLRRAQYNVQASSFIQEEIDSLRALPFTEVLTRTNGRFLGLAMTRGPWKVKTVTSPPSGTKAYAMETAQTAIVEETGLAVLPGNYREDITAYTAKVQALPSSPSGWGVGIAFRYRDAENHYRFRLSSGGAALDKVVQGTKSTVWSNSTSNSTGTWYTLEVVVSGNSITLKRNGSTLTTQTDNSFATGDLALLTANNALAYFDDVSVTADSVTTSWNFDADADGSVPIDWQRMSVFDLPSGTGTVTIADYLGDAAVKQATVNVTWGDAGQTKSASGTTLLTK
jgi:hypothetical protein